MLENGTYLLLLSPRDNLIIRNLEAMGRAPCCAYYTLKEAQEAKARMEREMTYTVSIVHVIE